ncbi:MAG TPA: flagellin [Gammaproteobacteria bacterium]|nr:flagellin [Gammaproteobacteria bacterium]
MSAIGSILTNDGALQALNSIRNASNETTMYQTQLSSGKTINSPADNPAGYITTQGFTSQINGVQQATSNANQGVSLLQTAQGAIENQTNILQKLNSIAVQAANGTQTTAEAQSLQSVVGQLTSQINTVANQTQFNNINLLDGNFNGVQFQVGAQNGQTISLSIQGTDANSLGMQASQAITGGSGSSQIYASGSEGVLTKGSGSAGGFSAGTVTIKGSNGSSSVSVTANESAKSIADAVNTLTGKTNVQAQATTQMAFTVGGSSWSFDLGNGSAGNISNKVHIAATGSAKDLANAINNHTSQTGVAATVNSAGNLVLTQSAGQNIAITNASSSAGKLTQAQAGASGAPSASTAVQIGGSSAAAASATIQGQVQFQSDQTFSLGSGSNIGLGNQSSLDSVSSIDVSSTGKASTAINIVKYALQRLGSEGGRLGAVQQRLQDNISNLNTTNQNLTSARSVVQDANIPQVSQKLTQMQIQEQAGVSALRSSSQLQQAFLKLLP